RNNFAWHFRAKFRKGFRDANEIEFVFLSLAEPALLVAPRPHFSLNDVFQIGYWNGETQNFATLCSPDETLITIVLRKLDIQFARRFSRVERMCKLLKAKAGSAQLLSNRGKRLRYDHDVGVDGVNWFHVAVHRQAADQAPRAMTFQ